MLKYLSNKKGLKMRKETQNKTNQIWTFANILTYLRILIIPIIFYMLYSKDILYSNYISCGLFILASITDYLDGYISRKTKTTSEIGRFLDPIADKLLVSTVLIALVQTKFVGMLETIIATVIICREIFVSGLREYLGNFNTKMPVSKLAKWKTATQLFAISFLIFGSNFKNRFYNSGWDKFLFDIYIVGLGLFLIASILTIWTGKQYMTIAFKYMKGHKEK